MRCAFAALMKGSHNSSSILQQQQQQQQQWQGFGSAASASETVELRV